MILLQGGYFLHTTMNVIIYKLTGNAQFVSFAWVFTSYYCYFLGILNLLEYRKVELSVGVLAAIVLGAVFCFPIFVTMTELQKQCVACSLFFYGYTLFLVNRKKKAYLILFLSIGFHYSQLFMAPMFLASKIKQKPLIIMVFASFLLRAFNPMTFFIQHFGGIGMLNHMTEIASRYTGNLKNFFQSGSLYFRFLFGFFFLSAFIVNRITERKELVNTCFLMIIVLNMNYAINQNFTRMLITLYPYYAILLVELLAVRKTPLVVSFTVFLLLVPFVSSCRMSMTRIGAYSTYPTKFLGNSVEDLLTSTAFDYFDYKWNQTGVNHN